MNTARTQLQIPHLQRFSGEWETRRLGEIGEISGAGVDKKVNPNEVPVRLVNYLDVYNKTFLYSKDLTHEVSARRDQVRHCAVEKGDIFFTPTSEVPDDIGRSAVAMEEIPDGVYSYHVVRLRLKTDWDLYFRAYAFDTNEFLNQASRECYGSGTRYVISLPKFRAMIVRFPPTVEEQRAIAKVLSDVDGLIGTLDALIAKKRAIKQAAMQQLLTGKTRLPGFTREWETRQIGDVVNLCSEKNNLAADIPVLTCSKHLGFVDSLSYFKNQIFSNDLSDYKIIRRGQIGYPMNHVEEGSIGLQDLYDVALVSPIYVVCSPRDGVNSYFLHRLLKLDFYRQEFAKATTSSIDRRGSLRWRAFSKIRVTLPPIDEQGAIASVLSDMEAEVAALERRRDKTRAIKQGMMQQLLTGRVRLVKSDAATV